MSSGSNGHDDPYQVVMTVAGKPGMYYVESAKSHRDAVVQSLAKHLGCSDEEAEEWYDQQTPDCVISVIKKRIGEINEPDAS